MKIVNIIGGLGNQMFQYAFALALKKQYPEEEIFLDTQHYNYIFFDHLGSCRLHNGYELNKVFPNVYLKIANRKELMSVSYFIPNYFASRVARRVLPARKSEFIEKQNYVFYPEVFAIDKPCYYEGYWQSAKFFLNVISDIQKAFEFPNPNLYNSQMKKEIIGSESVGIHIRRGDYLLDPEYKGLCDLDYYSRAIQRIGTENKHFFIFSNDIGWCKENIVRLLGDASVTYVEDNVGQNSAWDIFLMSQCKELVIANSSFSWWGAFLNKEAKTIIAPKKWINRNYEADVYLEKWIKL